MVNEPKNRVLACLTINAEDAGLGPLSFLATNIDVIWQPITPLQHEYCMNFQLNTLGGFTLPSGKTEAMRCLQRLVQQQTTAPHT
jgi:hypothetical protein